MPRQKVVLTEEVIEARRAKAKAYAKAYYQAHKEAMKESSRISAKILYDKRKEEAKALQEFAFLVKVLGEAENL